MLKTHKNSMTGEGEAATQNSLGTPFGVGVERSNCASNRRPGHVQVTLYATPTYAGATRSRLVTTLATNARVLRRRDSSGAVPTHNLWKVALDAPAMALRGPSRWCDECL
jgi:hypothetical protein